jgi:DNA polymerase III subunit gamma/tau
LYRRYRPETFAEVIGQDHVTTPLRAALANNRVNHAYLFSGPRGCGKTTSARILARALNCDQAPVADPCGECDSCRDLARGGPGSIDVIEIDAASHGGVDDARDLREKAFFSTVPPMATAPTPVTYARGPSSRRCAAATRSTSSTRPTWSRRRASTRC